MSAGAKEAATWALVIAWLLAALTLRPGDDAPRPCSVHYLCDLQPCRTDYECEVLGHAER